MDLKSKPLFQIFIQSPNPQIPTQTLTLPTTNPPLQTIIKSILFPNNSFFLTLNGKPISNSTKINPLSTLTLHFRLSGGGGDGGSTCAESRDCFLNMYKGKVPDKADPNEIRLSKFINCSLSNEPLRHPIVIDKLGNLFNKEALVEGLLKKSLPKQYGYIKGLKDMISVELCEIKGDGREGKEVRFQCPITGQEFNGMYRFYAIRKCGHVLSAKGLKEIKTKACLICHEEFEESDKIVINGSEEEVKELWEKLKEEKAVRVVGGKDKKSKKVENGRVSGTKHGMEMNVGKGNGMGLSKKLKMAEEGPDKEKATSAVYASIFTSSKKKSDFRETYSCRSLPLGRNL